MNISPSYNIPDLYPVPLDGSFFDFTLLSGHQLIVDYSCVDKEIIVGDAISLGQKKVKGDVGTISELTTTLFRLYKYMQEINQQVRNRMFNQLEPVEMIFMFGATQCVDTIKIDADKTPDVNIPEIEKRVHHIVNQVVFDILYEKYLSESPLLTLYQYYRKFACYGWDKPFDNDAESLEKKKDATRKWMVDEIKREVAIKNNPRMREDSVKLGRNPDQYIDFLSKINAPGETHENKPKTIWDYLFYNGHPRLITSKQFRRSLVKQKRDNSNYTYEEYAGLFKTYDEFAQMAFMADAINAKDYFTKSMDFYHLEIYKRVDFIYKLAVHMENARVTAINKNNLLVKRFAPIVMCPYQDEIRNCLIYNQKYKYYKPFLMLEKSWDFQLEANSSQLDSLASFDAWTERHYVRAKLFELFNYHYAFTSCDFDDISAFIRNHYDVLSYHDPSKEWIQEGKKTKQDRVVRLKNALEINEAFFWDSDKRRPAK